MYQDPERVARVLRQAPDVQSFREEVRPVQMLDLSNGIDDVTRAALRNAARLYAARLISSMFDEPRADVSYEEYRDLVAQEREERRRRFMEAE